MTKFVIYDRTESLAHSLASDVVTFGCLLVCIWFSRYMGGRRVGVFYADDVYTLGVLPLALGAHHSEDETAQQGGSDGLGQVTSR